MFMLPEMILPDEPFFTPTYCRRCRYAILRHCQMLMDTPAASVISLD